MKAKTKLNKYILVFLFFFISASFVKRVMEINDYVINFQIWDTAGQERYMALVPMYLRGAQVALIVYDVTEKVRLIIFYDILIYMYEAPLCYCKHSTF